MIGPGGRIFVVSIEGTVPLRIAIECKAPPRIDVSHEPMQELGSLDKTSQLRPQHRPADRGSVNSPYLLPHLLIHSYRPFPETQR